MTHLDYFWTMSDYNRWMNLKLYEVCASMPDELRKRDLGAFFGSPHGILNHLLLADRVWLGRFTGQPFQARSLDQELYSDFTTLRHERGLTDEAIVAYLATVTEAQLTGTLHYTSLVNPHPCATPLGLALLHFFNHQTHHRGQLTTLMSQQGYDSGVTDLIGMPQAADTA